MSKAVQTLTVKGPVLAKSFMEAAKPRLETFMKYAKVELVPPTPGDIPAIRSGIGKLLSGARTGRWKNVTVKVLLFSLNYWFFSSFLWFYCVISIMPTSALTANLEKRSGSGDEQDESALVSNPNPKAAAVVDVDKFL